jgi:hypothetical protein
MRWRSAGVSARNAANVGRNASSMNNPVQPESVSQ